MNENQIMNKLILATLLLTANGAHASEQANLTCTGIIENGFSSYQTDHKTFGKKIVTISYRCDGEKDKDQTNCDLRINGEEYLRNEVTHRHYGQHIISDGWNINIDPKTKELMLRLRDGNSHTQRWLNTTCTDIK